MSAHNLKGRSKTPWRIIYVAYFVSLFYLSKLNNVIYMAKKYPFVCIPVAITTLMFVYSCFFAFQMNKTCFKMALFFYKVTPIQNALMAEVHFVGQLLGAESEGFPSSTLFCKWGISYGSGWKLLEGLIEGQTQVDAPASSQNCYWSHPIDVHFATKGIQGWPKFYFQVWSMDTYGRSDLCGYGFIHAPSSPGLYRLNCVTWRPEGSRWEEFNKTFLGGSILVQSNQAIYSGKERCTLQTVSAGSIQLEIHVVLRNFQQFGVEF